MDFEWRSSLAGVIKQGDDIAPNRRTYKASHFFLFVRFLADYESQLVLERLYKQVLKQL